LLGDKFDILKDGVKCCEFLHLNFDKVYSKTNTSYKPLKHKIEYSNSTKTWYEEEWFSDYKSASSVERVEAFLKLGRKDPVNYADAYGPVSWEHVVESVKQVIDKHDSSRS
jgi:7-cyano-7-deazaguanine synthase